MLKAQKIRSQFPFFSKNSSVVYLDNAATTHKPQEVIDALVDFYTYFNANVHRGIHAQTEHATSLYEAARASIAEFIGALPEEIIFTSGTTAGINGVATSWALNTLHKDDVIVLSELEHHSNMIVWQHVARKTGAQLRYLPITADGFLDESNLESFFDDRVKLVAITQVSNAIGTHIPIQKIKEYAKKVGALLLVDAAQSVAHQPIDVKNMGADFLVFSGHKMFGPTGIGVLYIQKELQDYMQPFLFGGGAVFSADYEKTTFLAGPHKFEAGTPPIAQAIGLAAAIDFIQSNALFDWLVEHEAHLCSIVIKGLKNIKGVTILGAPNELEKNGHLVSFLIKGFHPHDIAAYLSARGIFVRAGNHCAQPLAKRMGYDASVRVSFSCYNTVSDVDILLNALKMMVFEL